MVTKTHTIPQSEGKFDLWVRNFVRAISSHPENYRIDQAEIDELTDQFNKWDADLNSAIAARDQARAAVENKDESRKTLESHVRGITRVI